MTTDYKVVWIFAPKINIRICRCRFGNFRVKMDKVESVNYNLDFRRENSNNTYFGLDKVQSISWFEILLWVYSRIKSCEDHKSYSQSSINSILTMVLVVLMVFARPNATYYIWNTNQFDIETRWYQVNEVNSARSLSEISRSLVRRMTLEDWSNPFV